MGDSYIQVPPQSTGRKLHTRQRTVGADTVEEQYVIPQDLEVTSYRGRACSFRTPGRAGTAGQKLASLFNTTGSAVIVKLTQLRVDMYQTVIKAVTVAPPVIRVYKVTAAPTNGTAMTKVSRDSAQSSAANVEVKGDASADGTGSGTALTSTLTVGVNVLSQEYAQRMITAAGYEPADRMNFLEGKDVYLRASEGVVLMLDYTLATQNPITDMWIASLEWEEFTLP